MNCMDSVTLEVDDIVDELLDRRPARLKSPTICALTGIADINENPKQGNNKTVILRGRVVRAAI